MEVVKYLTNKDNTWTWEIYIYTPKKEGTYATHCRGIIKSIVSYSTAEAAGEDMDLMIKDLGLED